ncbi:hypothetical protein SYJ56_07505 [Algoriphagus sp. D3-2-R+10]|uniref:hypothetical protein n=1 Tax=Algoriphagus aurantiacus TaxID=3103948 RepID=UPI002B39A35E|nr:hypothetical protein [Algoriphagus sp. D3-2-R+10]MEB2775148.1 hypothetical protein [Algoriphagus sp. D3-2-R+10]
MELEEMKSLWADLSLQVEKQDKIQKELLMEITKQKFRKKLNTIRISEILGSLVCVGYAVYLLSHFSEFELWYNQIFALISIFIMIALPTASLTAIKGMRNVRIDSETPSTILNTFIKNKIRFEKVHQYGMISGGIVMITILPPLAELSGSLAKILNPVFWMIYIPVGLVFMYFFSRWGLKKYKGVIDSSEKMLRELE